MSQKAVPKHPIVCQAFIQFGWEDAAYVFHCKLPWGHRGTHEHAEPGGLKPYKMEWVDSGGDAAKVASKRPGQRLGPKPARLRA